jgi:hypothetical protein
MGERRNRGDSSQLIGSDGQPLKGVDKILARLTLQLGINGVNRERVIDAARGQLMGLTPKNSPERAEALTRLILLLNPSTNPNK